MGFVVTHNKHNPLLCPDLEAMAVMTCFEENRMKTGKTLYLSDLDGTLLNKDAELSQYTKDALNRMVANGLCFSVATARTAATALKILDGVRWSVPLVLMNGVLIFDTADKRYIQVLSLGAATVAAVLAVFNRLDATGLMYQLSNNEQATYYESLDHKPLRDFVEERKARYNKSFQQASSFGDIPPEGIVYFVLLDSHDRIQLAYEALSEVPGICRFMYKDIYSPDTWDLEILSNKASKQNAAVFLRETYGFERVVGFGDGINDLPLFAACDVKVAVENADPEVRAAADYICDTNNNDGVVKWIEKDFAGGNRK